MVEVDKVKTATADDLSQARSIRPNRKTGDTRSNLTLVTDVAVSTEQADLCWLDRQHRYLILVLAALQKHSG